MEYFTLAIRDAWTPSELGTLRKLWRTATDAELLAALPNRTYEAIQRAAKRRFHLTLRERPQEATDATR